MGTSVSPCLKGVTLGVDLVPAKLHNLGPGRKCSTHQVTTRNKGRQIAGLAPYGQTVMGPHLNAETHDAVVCVLHQAEGSSRESRVY